MCENAQYILLSIVVNNAEKPKELKIMNNEEKLIESFTYRKPILFVGAGFSAGAICNGKISLSNDLQLG